MKRLSTTEFIEKAIAIHGNKYDYSNVTYNTRRDKILINCPTHGTFLQTPAIHLSGRGCSKCGHCAAVIPRAQTKLIKYGHQHYNNREQCKITCIMNYGVEHQSQNEVIKRKKKLTNVLRLGVENPMQSKCIQQKAKQTNLEIYGHTNIAHGIKQEKIRNTILERYGVEYPLQNKDVSKKARQACLERYGTLYYFQSDISKDTNKQNNIHKYGVEYYSQHNMVDILPLIEDRNWLFNQYILLNKTAVQIASELGIGDTTLGRYLRKSEIEIKQNYWISYKCVSWLKHTSIEEDISIIPEYQWNTTNLRRRADGYCVDTNTIYEFHGDYWHGNPDIYSPAVINEVTNKSMGELHQTTIARENEIKSLGYNLIVIWESDWDKQHKYFKPIENSQKC